MPGWYLHMNAARQAVTALRDNPRAAALFAADGPSSEELERIAQAHPAYVALGAIGPDIFFLLPDFKGSKGQGIFAVAQTLKELYQIWHENFTEPYERAMGEVSANREELLDALTGGLAAQLSGILENTLAVLKESAIALIMRSYDVFSLIGSGVPLGVDESTFYWSDMLHYRKTYAFAAEMWRDAALLTGQERERCQAFALGWMVHLATDVTGHGYVNEKTGGPYRLHWQRHHLVENHMDAHVYAHEHAGGPLYPTLTASSMHLWLAFNPDGQSATNFFLPQPGPDYDPSDSAAAALDRRRKFGVDSELPPLIASFLHQALVTTYSPREGRAEADRPFQALKDHPMILSDIVPGAEPAGFPSAADISNAYWYMYEYVRMSSTAYFDMRRPVPPDTFILPPFPSPPGTGERDSPPRPDDSGVWPDMLEFLLSIAAWIEYLLQVATYPAAALTGIVAGAGTKPVRDVLYGTVELPVYNAWQAIHWYLSMTGFALPLPSEINRGLHSLGAGVSDAWADVQRALNTLDGNLTTFVGTEPSGRSASQGYPLDVVTDTPSWLGARIPIDPSCEATALQPSEFLRPWSYPFRNNAGEAVPLEPPTALDSPFLAPSDPTVLMGGAPGNNAARELFAACRSEEETFRVARTELPAGRHLGDPVDYAAYVIAQLTRTRAGSDPDRIANFNLDADRNYGSLAWDWVRRSSHFSKPLDYSNGEVFRYCTPLQPGAGWCRQEAITPPRPAARLPGSAVDVRYIDHESPFASGGSK